MVQIRLKLLIQFVVNELEALPQIVRQLLVDVVFKFVQQIDHCGFHNDLVIFELLL